MTLLVLSAALIFGEPQIVPLAVPFAIALALGLRRTAPIEVSVRFALYSDRALEGDTIGGRVEISWDGELDAHAMVHRLRGLSSLEEGATAWKRASRSIELPLSLTAMQWGRHSVGEVWLRLTQPFGLVSWTGKVMVGPQIRVLPGSERLGQLLSPTRSRTVWGVHRSTRLGDGHEFAELRPYVAGDRLRDLNWAASARHRTPIVNRHHPEVSGDVVIALEAFDDGSAASREVLIKTARAAWALASFHMRANDRVGLVRLGRGTQWLPPAGGRLAQYKLMDTLLQVGGEAADMIALPRRWVDVPQSALVIALTTLHSELSVATLTSWRARGRSVAVVMIDPSGILDPPESLPEVLASRLWALELEHRLGELRHAGIPVVRGPVDGAVAPMVSALRRARRAPSMRRS